MKKAVDIFQAWLVILYIKWHGVLILLQSFIIKFDLYVFIHRLFLELKMKCMTSLFYVLLHYVCYSKKLHYVSSFPCLFLRTTKLVKLIFQLIYACNQGKGVHGLFALNLLLRWKGDDCGEERRWKSWNWAEDWLFTDGVRLIQRCWCRW